MAEEIEYNEEQKKDIEEMIRKDREREHRAIAGDQFYRIALISIAQQVQAGIYDIEVLRVGEEESKRFSEENPILGRKKTQKPDKPGKK